jgi:pyruvate formate lyase activating enzyme
LKFAGFIKNSFVDYPNEIAAVVFTLGCNFNCWYCHNRELIDKNNKNIKLIDEKEILDFLNQRKGFLDGLVITGGEPTICSDLKEFICKVKSLGLKVKLDTNGTNPKILQELIDKKLVDFVAMDIKTSLPKYESIIETKCNIEDIKKSIDILMKSGIDYEFRTTFAPDVSLEDIEEIAKTIKGAKSYAIQKYNPLDEKIMKIPHSLNDFKLANEKAKQYVNSFLRSLN